MSENMKSRQNRVRRNVTALVSAVALACGTTAVVAPSASSYTQSSAPIEPGYGPETGPVADVTVSAAFQTFSQFESRSTEVLSGQYPGEEAGYVISVDLTAPRPRQGGFDVGNSDIYAAEPYFLELSVHLDDRAPLIDGQSPQDHWEGTPNGAYRPQFAYEVVDDPSGGKVAHFAFRADPAYKDLNGEPIPWLGSNPHLTLYLPAKVADGVKPGEVIQSSAEATAYVYPFNVMTEVERSVSEIDKCTTTSTYLHKFDGGSYGSWLMDIQFGSQFADDQTVGDPVIEFYDSDPRVGGATRLQFDAPDFRTDKSGPYFPTPVDGVSSSAVSWDRSANWVWSPETRTGKTWLPDGTWAQVEHTVRNTTCASDPANFVQTTDPLKPNSVIVIENARPAKASTGREQAQLVVLTRAEASIGDRVWYDNDGDGRQSTDASAEPGVAGVKVTASAVDIPAGVTLTDAQRSGSATTDASGNWQIDGLYPGVKYKVEFDKTTLPAGYVATRTKAGSDVTVDSNGLSFNTEAIAEGTGGDNLTYDLGVLTPASIGNFAWDDGWVNDGVGVDAEGNPLGDAYNGVQNDGEAGIGGVEVVLTDMNDQPVTDVNGNEVKPITTNEKGEYSFTNLYPGTYKVRFTAPTGYELTKTGQGTGATDNNGLITENITLTSGQYDDTIDLGLVRQYQPKVASIGDRVWVDTDGDGLQGTGETTGVSGVKVFVTPEGGSESKSPSATTDTNGKWEVTGLTPGRKYSVRFELPEGTEYVPTETGSGTDVKGDSNGLSFNTEVISEGTGGNNLTYDLGVIKPASVGNFVWDDGEYTVKDGSKTGIKDTDYNGVQDDGEPGIAGIRVTLLDASGNPAKDITGKPVEQQTTDANGNYTFTNLRPGEYTVKFAHPEGYESTLTGQGTTDNDSDGPEAKVTLKSGEKNLTIDSGFVRRNATTTTVTKEPTTTPTTTVTKEPTTTPTTTVTKEPTTTPTTTVTKEPTTTPTTTVTKEPTTTVTTVTTVTTPGNCKTCTPTTVTSTIPTTVPTTLTSTTEVPTTVKETVVKTTTNKVVVTDENTAIIGDKVYVDNNGDGKQDPDENEGVPNVTVIVTGKDGEEQRTVTDKDGNWQLVVQPGDYTVKFETDRVPSVPEQVKRSIVVKPSEKRDDIDLGVLRPGTVGDRVWEDTNGDGKQDEGEKGVPNVIVKVARDGEPTRTTYTDENGKWTVEGLTPNTEYRVEFVTPEGWTRTNTPAETVTLKPGATNLDYDLGIKRVPTDKPVQPGQFGGSIVINNPDGSREGVENVIVRATPPAGVDEPVRTSTSDKGGSWTITDLTPDTEYTVTYIIPRGYQVINLPKGATLDKDGNVTVTAKVNRELPTNLGFDLEVERGSSIPGTPTTVTVTETPVTNTTEVQVQSSNDFLSKCWANATQSPFLYLAPIALIGAVGGELARPYMGAINEQLNQLNAQLQGAFRRDTPEWGDGGRGADREDPFAEFRAQIDAANRQLQQMAADPNIQRLGGIAAGVLALIAAGTVIYDWCSNEPGEAKTASSRRGGAATATSATTAPTTTSTTSTTSTTTTEPTPKP